MKYRIPSLIISASGVYIRISAPGARIVAAINSRPKTMHNRSMIVMDCFREQESCIPQNLATITEAPMPIPMQHT